MLFAVNKTLNFEIQLKQSGKIGCFVPVCDPNTGYTDEEDVCPGRLNNTVCYSSECLEVASKTFECVDIAEGRPSDTYCTRYECQGADGWVPVTITTEKDCKDEFTHANETLEKEYRCKKIYCSDIQNQCVAEDIEDCSDICTQEIISNCTATAIKLSSPEQCYTFKCKEVKVGEEEWIGKCDDEEAFKSFTNCLETELYEQIVNNNTAANVSQCCSIKCNTGKCVPDCKPMPKEKEKNKCIDFICTYVSEGQWNWKQIDSEEALTCESNECWKRECVPSKGCQNVTEICEVKSNECYTFYCNYSTMKCDFKSLLIESECTSETCENGKIKVWDKIERCNLTDKYKCIDRKCVYNKLDRTSKCEYFDIEPAENDICRIYSCDNESGNWTDVPKCDDGIYCTENVCTIFGECKYPDITCQELSMEDYPCFERRCREDLIEKKYVCYRKLIGFVDVCGRCIMEEDEDESSSDSSSHPGMDLTSCTNAPPKPLYTEGLAAASIALIILAAVVVGAAIATSGVMGTKSLIDRAKGANNTSAHSNPLFESADTEMTNPAFAGTAV